MHLKKKKKEKNKRPFHIQHTGWILLGINKLSKTRAYVKKLYVLLLEGRGTFICLLTTLKVLEL